MRGKSGNSPFLPGGLDDVVKSGGVDGEDARMSGNIIEQRSKLLTVAPGLSRGLRIPGVGDDKSVDSANADMNIPPSLTNDSSSHGTTEIVRFLL